MAQPADIHRIDSLEAFADFAYAQGWTDGLPVLLIRYGNRRRW